LKDGRSVTGTIAKETDDAVHVAGNTLEGTPPTEIARGSILAIKRSDISTMPPGLLNALGKEEILNLLAYLRSAGSDQALQNSEPPN
jgi:putative heme-binding domain-containing protein